MSNDESFFREVEEDYRREQTVKFFKTYGAYLIAGAFVILAIVGGYKYEHQRRAAQAAIGGDALSNAMNLIEAGNQDEAEKALGDARRQRTRCISRSSPLACGGRIGGKQAG